MSDYGRGSYSRDEYEKPKFKFSKAAIVTGVILLIVLIFGAWLMANYNSLVSSNAKKDNSWAKVETQYQRRNDLIDNIVSSVKGAQKNEQKFVDIAQARSGIKPIDPNAPTDEKAATASQNEATVVSIVPRLQEAYPELKSNEQVSKLVAELQGTENEISKVRNTYNDTVTNYNVGITSFPKNIFANMFGFKKANLYKADATASKAPKVEF